MSETLGYGFPVDGVGERAAGHEALEAHDPSLQGGIEAEAASSATGSEQAWLQADSDQLTPKAVPARDPGESLPDYETRLRFGR